MSTVTAEASHLLALGIGGTKVGWARVAATAASVVILERGSIGTDAASGGQAVMSRLEQLIGRLCADFPEVVGVGVASAGVIDPHTGRVISATNTMPGWGGTELGRRLSRASGLPVSVINDVHAHGLGEATYGAGRGAPTVLAMAVGTGVGGAVVRDGHIVFGDHFVAGHFGHVHHHYAQEVLCSCGRMGHIEGICSGWGATHWYNMRKGADMPELANGRQLQDAAEAGNKLAQQVITDSAFALGESLGSLANCLDPSVVVLSGSMTKNGDMWWESVREGYRRQAMDPVQKLDLVVGTLGDDAPLVGASVHFMRLIGNKKG